MSTDEIDVSTPAMLSFYRRLYPYKSIFNWLNHEHTPTRRFTHREFAFTLQGDVYLRYNSFATAEEMKKQVCMLNPTRFEIGPVYSARPRDKKTARPGAFVPVQRELVFDIDMTDYDPVRTCCSGADICRRCWSFISAAVRVLDNAIRDQYGYRHLLWVYSGRRGIHLWISDKEATDLTDEQRKAIVGWLSVIAPGIKEASKKLNFRGGHFTLPPSLRATLTHLSPIFVKLILEDQDCFGSTEGWETLLEYIHHAPLQATLRKLWSDDPTRSSVDKWGDIKSERRKKQGEKEFAIINAIMEDIIIQYTYPRLDAEVSKHRNHLLKAPFCIHPKTGRVCVPVDPSSIEEFDPSTVPTITQLLKELDALPVDTEESSAVHHADWEKTSLKPYVEMLDRHCMGLMEETRKVKRGAPDMTW
ncbi:hypothetical protein HGRIS_011526 [Hohenbuehelia grisea]|uniref:DNA primase n=2 Tax=Hohenbuehelia grisea TaxID=104357 RepID=A0ABR3JWQ6_9AGAR